MRRTPEELAYFLDREGDDISNFADGVRNPQMLVERGRLKPGQRLWRPHTALACDKYTDKLLGFATFADNTSGDHQGRKAFLRYKRRRVLRMVAVEPAYQRRGIGLALVSMGYAQASLWMQPASTYLYANEDPRRVAFLQSCGFSEHSSSISRPQPYGPDTERVTQVRYRRHVREGGARGIARHILTTYGAIAEYLN